MFLALVVASSLPPCCVGVMGAVVGSVCTVFFCNVRSKKCRLSRYTSFNIEVNRKETYRLSFLVLPAINLLLSTWCIPDLTL